MSDESSNDPQPAPPPPACGEEIRESAWQVAQQAAQMFGEIGGGAAGLTGAALAAKQMLKGNSGSTPPSAPSPETGSAPGDSD